MNNTATFEVTAALTDEDFAAAIGRPGLFIFDVYSKPFGPCEAIQSILKKLKQAHPEILLGQALAEGIDELDSFRGRSCPTFFLYFNGELVNLIRGANGVALEVYFLLISSSTLVFPLLTYNHWHSTQPNLNLC